MSGKASWRFDEGDQIVAGRFALRSLGGGKRYETWLAWDEHLLTTVVIKMARPDVAADEETRRRLTREAGILSRLAHPVIVRAFGAGTDGERPHLVLEHLEGPTLRTLVRRHGRLALEQALPLAQSLCAGLHYLREEGFVHLDVKPGNVVMEVPPRLIDFSIARSVEDAAAIARAIGTGAYMAPEQCEPEARGPVGPPADWWGLGATLYEAVAGHRPFPKGDEQYPQLTSGAEPLPRDVPAPLAELIGTLLSPDPAARPAPADVLRILEPLIAAEPRRVLRRRRPRIN